VVQLIEKDITPYNKSALQSILELVRGGQQPSAVPW
jgi:hypothetical protein